MAAIGGTAGTSADHTKSNHTQQAAHCCPLPKGSEHQYCHSSRLASTAASLRYDAGRSVVTSLCAAVELKCHHSHIIFELDCITVAVTVQLHVLVVHRMYRVLE